MSLTRGLTTDVIVLEKVWTGLKKSKMVKKFVKVCLHSTQAEEISLQFHENITLFEIFIFCPKIQL